MLGRETLWRQGDLLLASEAERLGIPQDGQNVSVVIISHDCDIANDSEASIEVMMGMSVTKYDPQFSKAKHPRKLQLCYTLPSGGQHIIELQHAKKQSISKDKWKAIGEQKRDVVLAPDEKRALKQ